MPLKGYPKEGSGDAPESGGLSRGYDALVPRLDIYLVANLLETMKVLVYFHVFICLWVAQQRGPLGIRLTQNLVGSLMPQQPH